MSFSFLIAKRYLFAKRTTNAINIIASISVLGIAIGTAALILVLSVFNGFEDLLSQMFGYFNPPVKVELVKGKHFDVDSLQLQRIKQVAGVEYLSLSLEEIAFFEYDGSQDFGTLKGVDKQFPLVNGIDSTITEGEYKTHTEVAEYAVFGAGLRNKLSLNIPNSFRPVTIYMPSEKSSGVSEKGFETRVIYPAGSFTAQQEAEADYVLADLDYVRELLELPNAVSSMEIKTAKGANVAAVKAEIAKIMGNQYKVRDRYEQNEAFFKVMNLEKWLGFAITSLILALMTFNMIGALWMIVLDKQKDISILKGMGATDKSIRQVFLYEGLLLTLLGFLLGVALAVGLYWAQKTYDLVSIPQGFLVDSYPIAMRISDFLPVTLVVLGLGYLASLAPANRTRRIPAFLKEE